MAFFERPFCFFLKKTRYIIHAHRNFLPCSFSLHALGYPLLFNDLDKNVNYHEHSKKWHFGEIFLYTRNSFIKKWQEVFSPIQIAGLYTLYLHCICFMFKSCFFFKFQTRLLPLTVNAMHQPRQSNSFYHHPNTTSTVMPSR